MRSADCSLQPQVESAPNSTVEVVSVTWGNCFGLGTLHPLAVGPRAAFLSASVGRVAPHQLSQDYCSVLWRHISCSICDVCWVLCIVWSFPDLSFMFSEREREIPYPTSQRKMLRCGAAWNPPLPTRVHLVSEARSDSAGSGQRENVVVSLPSFSSVWIAWIYALPLIVKRMEVQGHPQRQWHLSSLNGGTVYPRRQSWVVY